MVVGKKLDDVFMVMEFMEHDLKGLMEERNSSNPLFAMSEVRLHCFPAFVRLFVHSVGCICLGRRITRDTQVYAFPIARGGNTSCTWPEHTNQTSMGSVLLLSAIPVPQIKMLARQGREVLPECSAAVVSAVPGQPGMSLGSSSN